MNSNKVVSICSTSYKHEPYIRDWTNGLLCQELPEGWSLQVIVGVDGQESQDDLQEILMIDWGDIDLRIIYNNKALGGPANLTQTISLATGSIISYLDCDDYYLPGKIKKSIEFMEKNNLDAVHHDIDCILPSGEYRKEAWSKTCWQEPIVTMGRLLQMNTIYTCSFMCKSEWIHNTPTPTEFAKKFSYLGDYPRFLDMCYNGAKIGWLPESLAVYRDSIGVNNKDVGMSISLDSKVREWGRNGCKREDL